jgi:signal peptide peptidase SppA
MNELIRDKAIVAGLLDSYWAMEPQVLGRMAAVILRHAQGVKLDGAEVAAIVAARGDAGQTQTEVLRRGAVAVIPATGVLVKHAHLVNGESQPRGTATLTIQERLAAAVADPAIAQIVLLLDSPGGSVFGIADLAEAIGRADRVKPVIGMAEDMAASAAYWLGSQCRKLYVNATGMLGSIGVYTVLVDSSRRADREGLRVEVVKAGEHKGVGVAGAPVSGADRQVVQDEVNALYEHFVQAVARGRGMDAETVRALADGRVHVGQAAVDLNLADGVTTLEALLEELETSGRAGGPPGRSGTRAAAGGREIEMSGENKTPPAPEAEAIRAQAVKEANQAAASRVKELTAVLGGRTELLTAAISEGLSATEAKARLADVLTAENKALGEQLAAAKAETAKVGEELAAMKKLAEQAGIKPVAVSGKEASDDEADGGKAYERAVAEREAELLKAGRPAASARATAYREVARQHPDWHEAWKSGGRK